MVYFGRPMKRFEDPRLLMGEGSYVDDMKLPGMLHASVLRSPHAHARIVSIDPSAALEIPGVVKVLTADGLTGVRPTIPPRVRSELEGNTVPEHPVLASEKVCYVGQAVAVVAAEDRYIVKDALDKIKVEYDLLPAVIDPLEAVAGRPVIIHPDLGTNVHMRIQYGRGDVDRTFAEADHVVSGTYDVPRLSATPMEGRGLVADYQADKNALTFWTSTQAPHKVKRILAHVLNRPDMSVRVIAPDVGGGFGMKVEIWPEDVAISYMAIELGRPVKWVEDRWENMLAYHARGHTGHVEAAVRNDGKIMAMRTRIVADVGAYFLTSTQGPPRNAATRFAGPYAIPEMDIRCEVVCTNKPSTGPYRGAGGPEGAFFMERTVDLISRDLNIDAAEVRKRNLISSDSFPHEVATGLTYDSGNYQPAFDRVLEMAEYTHYRQIQRERRPEEPLIGVGVATVVKASGGQGEMMTSVARVEVQPTGHVKVYTEISPHGQGTETTFSQIVADQLGLRPEDVTILHGDTDDLPFGQGTFASRGMPVGSSAMQEGLIEARGKMSQIAGHILECSPDEIVFQDGRVYCGSDPEKAMSFSEVATAAQDPASLPPGTEPGLEFEKVFDMPHNPYSFAAHIAVVEVDQDTGDLTILKYAAVHDCGPVVNPKLLEAQIQGAMVQGLGQALSEGFLYDSEGQPVAGTFLDYAIPFAEDVPAFDMESQETASPMTSLGVKGIGELPTVASPVALANAVMDALSATGIRRIDTPLTSEKIWQALQTKAPKRRRRS